MDLSTTLAGNLVEDPELRTTSGGQPVATVRVAHTARRFDRASYRWVDGGTTYLNGSVSGAPAEHVAASLRRGDRVLLAGRLQQRDYTTAGRGEAQRLRARHRRGRRQPPLRHRPTAQGRTSRRQRRRLNTPGAGSKEGRAPAGSGRPGNAGRWSGPLLPPRRWLPILVDHREEPLDFGRGIPRWSRRGTRSSDSSMTSLASVNRRTGS